MKLLILAILVLISGLQVFSVPVGIYYSDNNGDITKYVEVLETPALQPAPSVQDEQVEETSAEPADDKIEGKSDDNGEPEGGSQPFEYSFEVKNTGNKLFFEKSEKSDGNQVTGSYSVLLPDGRIQVVEYVADKENGFAPRISYNENNPFEKTE